MTAAALAAITVAAAAQQPTFKRIEVQRGDLSTPGKEVVQAIAEIPSGASAGRHTHPGEEVAYVLEGTVLVEIDGKPAATLKAGQGVIIPAGAIHNATNKSGAGARVLATYIIDKGKPVATPVK
jgi:quercetin dioxygenase-like cupin family protein